MDPSQIDWSTGVPALVWRLEVPQIMRVSARHGELSRQVCRQESAQDGAADVTSRIIPGFCRVTGAGGRDRMDRACPCRKCAGARAWAQVTDGVRAVRRAHDLFSLPFGRDGSRLVSDIALPHHAAAVRAARMAYEDSAHVYFMGGHWDDLRAHARAWMGGLYEARHYEAEGRDLVARAVVRLTPSPVPWGQDMRLAQRGIGEEEARDMERRARAAERATMAAAMRAPYERLLDAIQHLAARAAGAGAVCHCGKCGGRAAVSDKFSASALSDLREVAVAARLLNLAGDPALEDLAARARDLAEGTDEARIRQDDRHREEVRDAAADIAARVRAVLPAAGMFGEEDE